jgi:hypothetical protein
MPVSRWSAFVRVAVLVLLVLASCPFTAPFQPADLAAPFDHDPADRVVLIHAKNVDDPTPMHAAAPVQFAACHAIVEGGPIRVPALLPPRPLQVPLRI